MKQVSNLNNGIDVFNTILFWGIILLVILIVVMAILYFKSKKKKEKESVSEETDIYTEQIPVKEPDTVIEPEQDSIQEEKTEDLLLPIEEPVNEPVVNSPVEPEPIIEEENNFVAEEHVLEYDNNLFNLPSLKKNNIDEPIKEKPEEPFTMPTKPYERNVLRQMSLSQTSPIGLTIPKKEQDNEKLPEIEAEEETKYIVKEEDEEIPIESTPIETRSTELLLNNIEEESTPTKEIEQEKEEYNELEFSLPNIGKIDEQNEEQINIEEPIKKGEYNELDFSLPELEKQPEEEKINIEEPIKKEEPIKENNQEYLEEVSRKLSEAEIPDEIERTEYEKQQEEEAIISYKELMEKKDTIQTVDEEDAVISIEELIQKKKEEDKLYNITENESTVDFISELKKFREDL